MKKNKAPAVIPLATGPTRCLASSPSPNSRRTWLRTTSGVAVLAVGLQGATANVLAEPSAPLGSTSDEATAAEAIKLIPNAEVEQTAAVEPTPALPRFSQLKTRTQTLLSNNQAPSSAADQSITHLEPYRRDLNRRALEVEGQLLSLQRLLSIEAYGTSFADRLLFEDQAYQTQLQQFQALEAEIHNALAQSDPATLEQLNNRLASTDQQLKEIAKQQLKQYIERTQTDSRLGLWQEPMYRELLWQLMAHTHDRHLLKARRQILARTVMTIKTEQKV